jgi:regulator of sirC expression with transglutaminase-like and TPR domain
MDEMLLDAISADQEVNPSEEPTQTAKELYKLLEEADKPLHDRTSQSSLSIVARLMTIKTQYNLPEACYNETMNLIREAVGDEAANMKGIFSHY